MRALIDRPGYTSDSTPIPEDRIERVADYYETNAQSFIADTQSVDLSELRARFLAELGKLQGSQGRILDAGTGSGRDAQAFRSAGFEVAAFDASPAMVRAATMFSGVPVRHLRFETFKWEHAFEGIWACASLLHVARADLPNVLQRLADHIVPGGILYASFKFGTGDRRKDGRDFIDMTEETLSALLDEIPSLRQVETWRSADRRPDRKEDIWLNALLRKS